MRGPLTTVGWMLGATLLALAALFVLQDRLLYLPTRAPLAELEATGLRAWPALGTFRALLATPGVAPRGTVVVFHGNAGHAGHRAHYADVLAPLGWRVLLAEYPGYGPREGAPGESVLVRDAVETLEAAHAAFGPPLVVVGESLGAAVAAQAAATRPALATGLLLLTPWDRLANVGAHHYPWLPVRWMLRDEYDSAQALARYPGPVTIVVAADDDVVPARFGHALHAASGRVARHLVVLEGVGHNDWPVRVDANAWRQMLARLAPATP